MSGIRSNITQPAPHGSLPSLPAHHGLLGNATEQMNHIMPSTIQNQSQGA